MVWKNGVKVIIACKSNVTNTPITRNLFILNIDPLRTIKAIVICDKIKVLNIMVRASVSE